jgi:hypothetical protein
MALISDNEKIMKIAAERGLRQLTKEEKQKLGLSTKSRYFVPADVKRLSKRTPVITRRKKEFIEKGGLSFERLAKIRKFSYKPFREESLQQIKRTRYYYNVYRGTPITYDAYQKIAAETSQSILKKFGKAVIRFYVEFVDNTYFSTGMIYSGDQKILDVVNRPLGGYIDKLKSQKQSPFLIKRIDVSIEV